LNFNDFCLPRDAFAVWVVASVQSDSSDSDSETADPVMDSESETADPIMDSEPDAAEPTTDGTLLLECETSPSGGLC